MAARRALTHLRLALFARLAIGLGSIVLGASGWASSRLPLASVLEQLRARGVPIAYSSALVPADLEIDVDASTLDAVTLDAVRDALPAVGLALERRGDLWLVVAGAHRPNAAPDRAGSFEPAVVATETIIVTGSRHRLASGAEPATLGADDLDLTPSLGGDALRAVNLLPGMSTMGVSVLPRVRGGLDDETLTLLDGVELLDPSHFFAYHDLFSSVDSHTVDDVDVYSGGFPARYGNRMSGVVAIDTLEQRDKPAAEIGLSLYSIFADARSDPASDTDWLVAARHSESDLLIDRLDLEAGRPDFTDATLRVGHAFSPEAKVTLGSFLVLDDLALNDGNEDATSKTDSRYLWSRFDGRFGPLGNATIASLVTSRREKDQSSPPSEDVVGRLHDTRDTTRVALRSDFSYTSGQIRQEFGLETDWSRAGYDSRALVDRGPLGPVLGGTQVVAHEIHETIDGSSAGAYWSADVRLADHVSVQPGLRWDLQTYVHGAASQLSPRLGVQWQPTEQLTLRADGGRYYQPQRVWELDTADGVTQLAKSQRADHYIASASWWTSAASHLRLEAYQKRYERCNPRFENVFNPFVLLPELADDRVEIDPSRARARGVDFEWQTHVSDEVTLTTRYSYMDADDEIEGRWVARRWSQHHTVTGIGSWTHGGLTASTSLAWHSGWRTSAPPTEIAAGDVLPLESLLDNRVMRDYLSVDLAASASWHLGRSTLSAFVDVTNTLDRENVVGIDYDVAETGGSLTLTPDHTSLLPIVPWVGITIAF